MDIKDAADESSGERNLPLETKEREILVAQKRRKQKRRKRRGGGK